MALNGKRVVAVIEARMTSARLPGKVLLPAGGKPLLQILIERLERVSRIDRIAVATTSNAADDPIARLAQRLGHGAFRGSEEDVLRRVSDCLKAFSAEVCVEVTGDCPLVDPALVDEALEAFGAAPGRVYVSNSDPHRAVPAGLDVQVFSARALHQLELEARDSLDREHVSYGFYRPESGGRWNPLFIRHPAAAGGESLLVTLDYPEDYQLIKAIHEALAPVRPDYGAGDIIGWIRQHPELQERCRQRRQAASSP